MIDGDGHFDKEPAEGSRETVERDLAKQDGQERDGQQNGRPASGDRPAAGRDAEEGPANPEATQGSRS